jgi:RNA polymerase sigma-70 factor (family 1)
LSIEIQNRQLFKQLATGDEAAFRALFDMYKGAFYATAFKLTRSADAAEEIVQEVFITLWHKRVQVDTARNPMGYVVTILHNSIYAHFRRIVLERQLKQKVSDQHTEVEENPVEELLLAKENRQLLQAVIGQLPPQQQLIYRLSKQEGMSREEIAKKLNISPNTVRNHLSAATEFLRGYFKKGASALVWLVFLGNM